MDRELPRLFETLGLPAELMRAALDDVAPNDVRRRVLATLGMAVDEGAPAARAGEVTTLSGVFEKDARGSEQTSASGSFAGSTPRRASAALSSRGLSSRSLSSAGFIEGKLGSGYCAEQPVTLSRVNVNAGVTLPPFRLPPFRLQPSRLQPFPLQPSPLQPMNLLYLAAAAAAGAVLAKAAHVALSGAALMSSAALTCESPATSAAARDTSASAEANIYAVSSVSERARSRANASAHAGPGRVVPRAVKAPAFAAARPSVRSPHHSMSGSSQGSPGYRAAVAVSLPCTVAPASEPSPLGSLSTPFSKSAAHLSLTEVDGFSRAAPVEEAADSSEDWLGEQLEILARAERNLLEDNPDATVRSFEEYRERFPQGLLNLQMAAVRQRAEQRFGAFIFP